MEKILITPEQCRAARAMLQWSQDDLAEAANVAKQTLVDFERGKRTPYDRTRIDIQRALEDAGMQFTENGDGVALKKAADTAPDAPEDDADAAVISELRKRGVL